MISNEGVSQFAQLVDQTLYVGSKTDRSATKSTSRLSLLYEQHRVRPDGLVVLYKTEGILPLIDEQRETRFFIARWDLSDLDIKANLYNEWVGEYSLFEFFRDLKEELAFYQRNSERFHDSMSLEVVRDLVKGDIKADAPNRRVLFAA